MISPYQGTVRADKSLLGQLLCAGQVTSQPCQVGTNRLFVLAKQYLKDGVSTVVVACLDLDKSTPVRSI